MIQRPPAVPAGVLVAVVGMSLWTAALGASLGLALPGVLGVDVHASLLLRGLSVVGVVAVVLVELLVVDRAARALLTRTEAAEAELAQVRAAYKETRETLTSAFEDHVRGLQLAHEREVTALRRGLEGQKVLVRELNAALERTHRAYEAPNNKRGDHER